MSGRPGRPQPEPDSTEPAVLLVTAHRWIHTVRLALAAWDAGFAIHLLAPVDHPLASLTWIRTVGAYSALRPRRSVVAALNSRPFDLVIPGDDLAAQALFGAYEHPSLTASGARTIVDSLGDPTTFPLRHDRVAVSELARESGVRTPATWALPTVDVLDRLLERTTLPAVLKTDGSFGGQSVIVAHDAAAARAAFDVLSRPPRLVTSVGRLVLDDEANSLRPSLARARPRVSLQSFVAGTPANLVAAAWAGDVLGSVAVRVVRTPRANGPATVVAPFEHPEMMSAAKVLAGKLRLSGLFGLDFIVSADGATATLIELNPRATPTAHLHPASQRLPLLDLLGERLGASPRTTRPSMDDGPVALFPQEALYHPGSPYLAEGKHDVPADNDDVVALCLDRRSTARPPLRLRVTRLGRGYVSARRSRR